MTSLEVSHSINCQERRFVLRLGMTIAVMSILGWIVGCTISDLDLHVREGALGDAGVNRVVKPTLSTPPAVAPLP